jgi:nitronate monooxygenase
MVPETTFDIPRVICAPMAGGPSTVRLAAAVCDAGGLGFLAAGYVPAEQFAGHVARLRSQTDRPFGVNLFVVAEQHVDQSALDRYLADIAPDAARVGVELGEPRFDDDDVGRKLALLLESPVAVVSFTFGCASAATVAALHEVGTQVWQTVTSVADARVAIDTGCDVLVAQGAQAGGHRGSFVDDGGVDALDTLDLVRELCAHTALPVIAAGGIADAADTDAALAAGAVAVQAGTAFLLADEAGTHELHRAAVVSDTPTAFTRAFTGRTARGVENAFMRAHPDAPAAYPQVHHATTPMRAAAKAAGVGDLVSCWAGTRHHRARSVPAADVVRALGG